MITEGYVVRRYQGRSGGRGPALIDIAQDHLLFRLAGRGLLDLGISLKGGPAIRIRHSVLALVAFHDLEEKIRACGGDRDAAPASTAAPSTAPSGSATQGSLFE